MVPIGGAGPVHACHIGMKLGLRRIIVPLGAGVASAFGFLAAPISFACVQGWVAPLASLDFAKLREVTGTMTTQGKAMAAAAGVAREAATARILGAMRYAGQGFQVEAEIPAEAITHGDAAVLRAKFEAAYLALYGRTEPSLPVECVSWQVIVAGPRPVVDLTQHGTASKGALHRGTRPAWFGGAYVEAPVLNRLALRPGIRQRLLALQGQDQIGDVAQVHAAAFIRLTVFIDKPHIVQARAFRQTNGEIAPGRHCIIAQPIRPPFLLSRK